MTMEKLPEIKKETLTLGQQPAPKDGVSVTIVNDTNYDVNVLVSNGFYGFFSVGYIKAGASIAMPIYIWALLDVHVLYQNLPQNTFIEWTSPFSAAIRYTRKKGMVEPGSTLKVTEM